MNNPYFICTDRELRILPTQGLLVDEWDETGDTLYDLKFIEAAVERLGIDELIQIYILALRLLPKENSWLEKLKSTNRVLDHQTHVLRAWDAQKYPAFLLQQILHEASVQSSEELQAKAESELSRLKKPYLFERFPAPSDPVELRTFRGHSDIVSGVTLSADGQYAVSASYDNTLKVWDVATGRELRTLVGGHSDKVSGVALSADGQLAVSASRDCIEVWDVRNGRELRTLTIPKGYSYRIVNSLALSTDGQLVAGVAFNCICLWKIETGEIWSTLVFPGFLNLDRLIGVALSTNGRVILSIRQRERKNSLRTVEVWNIRIGKVKFNESHTLHISFPLGDAFALNADGRLAVFASTDHTLRVWDMKSERELSTLKGHHNTVNSIALSADGRLAISASSDHTIKVWDVEAGRELRTLILPNSDASKVALSTDGRLAISALGDHTVKVWDISAVPILSAPMLLESNHRDGQIQESESEEGNRIGTEDVTSVALSADGRLAISAQFYLDYAFIEGSSGALKVWDVETGRELRTLRDPREDAIYRVVELSADGRLAVSSDRKRGSLWDMLNIPLFTVWDTMKGHILYSINSGNFLFNQDDEIGVMALSADGRLVVSASRNKTIIVWDVKTKRKLRTLKGHRDIVTSLALSADGRLAVSGSSDTTVKMWDVATGRELRTIIGYDGENYEWRRRVKTVALSANGRLAVFVLPNNRLKIWDVVTGNAMHTLIGHTGVISGIALSADGRLAVSASHDQTIKTWDVTSGHCIATLVVGAFRCCAISANGKTIVVGDNLGRVHFLELVGEVDDIEVNRDLKWLTEPSFDWSWIEEIKKVDARRVY